MKTLLFYASVTITLFIFLSSCTKEKPDSPLVASPQSDEKLVSQVHWFMDAAKDVKEGKYLKSGEKMFLDTALLYIESSLNYKYSYTNEKFKDYYIQEVEVIIPYLSAENKTYVVDAVQAYNLTLQKFREIYQTINFGNKKFYMCSINNWGTTNNGNSITIKATAYFGYGTRIAQSANEIGYSWLVDGGDCEGMGQYGAPNYLRDNYMPAIYLPCPNPRVWYDQTGNYEFLDPTIYPNPNGGPVDNYCDYQLFYASSNVGAITPIVECVGSESINGAQPEIEYYSDQLQSLIDAKLNSLNRQFMDVTFNTPDQTVGNVRTIKHLPTLLYGKIHFDCSHTPIDVIPITTD